MRYVDISPDCCPSLNAERTRAQDDREPRKRARLNLVSTLLEISPPPPPPPAALSLSLSLSLSLVCTRARVGAIVNRAMTGESRFNSAVYLIQ